MTEIRRICLITGASAGIGADIAREYALRGWDLALTARREEPMITLAEELSEKYGTTSHIFPLDLADPFATRDLVARIAKKGILIDGLVNNAGYGMAERGFGRIINVASLAGHMPGSKGHTTYAAIKSFLIKFSQSLNAELKDNGVHVSALCPGFTYSEFHDVNGTREAAGRLPNFMWMDSKTVAESGVEACERNKTVHITGRVNKGLAVLNRLMPDPIAEILMAKNSKKFRKTDG